MTRPALAWVSRVINKYYEGVCVDTGSLDQSKRMKAVLRLPSYHQCMIPLRRTQPPPSVINNKEVTLTTGEWRPTPGPGSALGLKAGSRQAMPGLNICQCQYGDNGEFWIWRQLQRMILKNVAPQQLWLLTQYSLLLPEEFLLCRLAGDTAAAWWLWLHWLGLQVRSVTLGPGQGRTQGRGGECNWPHLYKVKIEECGAISGVLEGEEGGTKWAEGLRRSSLHQRKR